MAQVTAGAATVDCEGSSTRAVNAAIKRHIREGARDVQVLNPAGHHSLAVALKADVRILLEGPVGWYAAGMNYGPHVAVHGNCGWGLAECQMDGRVEVFGHAGSGAAASIRGGLVYVERDSGARAGISMKGGTLVVGGSVGYMSGFMMQRGNMVICGDAAEGLGDSMYDGSIYVGGKVAAFGADAEVRDVTDEDRLFLRETLNQFGIDAESIDFTKVQSGRKLWNFSTKEPELWKDAL
ncbi:MAG TPA: glutamate synthase [Actinomycetota bacterium]|nr:glutamate synthase [Actinomycetota bacterium]